MRYWGAFDESWMLYIIDTGTVYHSDTYVFVDENEAFTGETRQGRFQLFFFFFTNENPNRVIQVKPMTGGRMDGRVDGTARAGWATGSLIS